MLFLNLLKERDEFGYEAKFNIDKKQKFRTPIGGFLYIFIIFVFT